MPASQIDYEPRLKMLIFQDLQLSSLLFRCLSMPFYMGIMKDSAKLVILWD